MTDTVFTHVTVIDATGAPSKRDMRVVVRGDRIVEIARTGELPIDARATVIEGAGKFLIPGLWDMHVHTAGLGPEFLPLYVANGVTGIREMLGLAHHHNWRSRICSGAVLGPRMVIASRLVDGPRSFWAGFPGAVIEATDEASGRDAVHRAVQEGADFVKVYSVLSRPAYFAIADEARRQGIPFAGHVPNLVCVTEASDAGQHTCEHMLGVCFAVSSLHAQARVEQQAIVAAWVAGGDQTSLFRRLRTFEAAAADAYDPSRAAVVFECLANNGTWHVPTLTQLRTHAPLDERAENDERLRYVPPEMLVFWRQLLLFFQPEPDQAAQEQRLFERKVELVGAMRRAGVGILAGTDCGNPYCFAGFGLHDELALLVQGGLTPMEALQAATSHAAECLGLLDTLGTVSVGKLADLVLLEANPLDDIRNTQQINAVMVGGRLITSTQREAMLAEVEAVAQRPPG
jgi:amidohydrolase family protein